MKQITLHQLTEPNKSSNYIDDKFYKVYLGNNLRVSFASKRQALKHLSQLSRVMNGYLFELVDIKKELYCEFWEVWFYLDARSNLKTGTQNKTIEVYVTTGFQKIYSVLLIIIQRCELANGIIMMFKHFRDIIDTLNMICTKLIELRTNKNHVVEINRLKSIKNKLNYILIDINSIQKNERDI